MLTMSIYFLNITGASLIQTESPSLGVQNASSLLKSSQYLKEGVCYVSPNSIPILRTMVLFLDIKLLLIYVPIIIYLRLP